ncbi:MAG: SAM-dependent methyltransferase [Halarcobacter sp.]
MDNQKIKFSKYINTWLYADDGYYSKYKQIGKGGDFYTAVSISPFFGGTIGKRIVDAIANNELANNCTILEIGAHHGYLLADIIQFIYTLNPKLLDTLNFAIVERFSHLQKHQKQYFKDSFEDKINLIHYDDIKEVKLNSAFIVANEIFDAFPSELVYTKDDILQMAYVENHKIFFEKCDDENIINHCKKYSISKGEIALGYEEFINTLCKNIKNFEFITFDYGDQYPRNDFSSRIYSRHEVFPIFEDNLDLEKYYKTSDITYDVFFNHLIDLFKDNKVKDIVYGTQMQALIEFGIVDLLEILKQNVDDNTYLRESQKVKTLLEPTGMGDRFKMLQIKK